MVRETGLEPYSVEHKPIGNTEFSNVCVMICVMSVFQRQTSLFSNTTSEMLRAASDCDRSGNDDALEKEEAALKKAQAEMTALEEETVNALTGESKMDLNFINSLIHKRPVNLEKALAEAERIRTEIENDAKLDELHVWKIETIRSWAETFEAATLETKRSIISALIDKIIVNSDYNLDIHFRITAQQYLGKAS